MKKYFFTIATFALGLILNAQVCLNPTIGSPFALAQQPFAITSADFNGDGKADLATADRNNSSVSVLLGDGVGSFTSTTSFTVGSFPNSITNADFNADGNIDLATTNNGSSNVSVLLGDGTGNFTATTSIAVGSAPFSITSADFDEDGNIDLAVANNSSNNISILLGNGLGAFAAAVNFTVGTGPISVISADFNSDSNLDLGVANATSNNVSVLFGNGAGSFSAAVNFSTGTFPRSIINGDFNADGKVDLATANDQSNNVSVLIGDGTGNFAPSVLYSVGTNPYAVTSADYNSDGKADLATANLNSNNVSVLLGNGAGSFAAAVNFGVGSVARSVISVDFNSDGRDDLISANFISLSVFLNETPIVTANATATVVCAGTNVTLTAGGATTYTWSGGISDGVAFIPGSTTTYTVTGTDGNGCTNTAVKTITVNPLPTANAGADQTLTCSSTSVTLNGSVSSPTNATVSWTGLGICGATNTAITSACAADIYTLTATDPVSSCSSVDLVEVFTNTVAPLINASSTTTLDCITTNANIIATTTTSPVSYNWTGSGIISGATISTATVNQPGIYTVIVTDLINSCFTTTLVTVNQDITLPSVTITVSSSVICSGNSATMTATGANSYSWSPGGQTTNSVSESPTSTTNYTITGTGINGCSNSVNQLIIVNPLPSISINGSTNICKGSTTTLFASGATSYTWNAGANTSSISISPTLTTTYSLTGEDANGCVNTSTTSVNIMPATNITGLITNTIGATTGDLILYKYTPGLSMWDSITTVPLTSTYSFTNIDSSLYVIRAIPTATNIQVTYANSAISWQDATVINHGCTTNSSNTITVVPLTNIGTGSGNISGTIIEADGFGQRSNDFKPMAPGNPIGGIIVKGGRNPGGQMFTQTVTATDGTYTLSNIPDGTGYFILVDIPGLDTNLTYHFDLTPGNNQLTGLDFTVDSMFINPILNVTGIYDLNIQEHQLLVYPNPTSNQVNINYTLQVNSPVSIELFDIAGRSVKTLLPLTTQTADKHKNRYQLADLNSGIYFIKLKINNTESTVKLFITN